MAAQETVEKLITEVRTEVLKRASEVLKRRMKGEDIDKEEIKELNKIKTELKFIEKTYQELNGGSKKVAQGEFSPSMLEKIKSLETTIGSIMQSMPK